MTAKVNLMATAKISKKEKFSPLYRPTSAFDVLSIPIIGTVLKSRYGRLVLQVPLAIIAFALIYDGFTGPDSASPRIEDPANVRGPPPGRSRRAWR